MMFCLRGSNLFWKALLLVVYPGTAWEWGPPVCPVTRSPVTIFRSTWSGIAAHWTAWLWKGRVLSLSEFVPLEHSLLGLGNRTSTSHPAWGGGSPWTRAAAWSWPSSPRRSPRSGGRSPAAWAPSPTTLTGLAKNSSFPWNQVYEKKILCTKRTWFWFSFLCDFFFKILQFYMELMCLILLRLFIENSPTKLSNNLICQLLKNDFWKKLRSLHLDHPLRVLLLHVLLLLEVHKY